MGICCLSCVGRRSWVPLNPGMLLPSAFPLGPGHRLWPSFLETEGPQGLGQDHGVKGCLDDRVWVDRHPEGSQRTYAWLGLPPQPTVVLTLCAMCPRLGPLAPCPGGAERHRGEPTAPHCPGGLPQPASGENRPPEPGRGSWGQGCCWGAGRGYSWGAESAPGSAAGARGAAGGLGGRGCSWGGVGTWRMGAHPWVGGLKSRLEPGGCQATSRGLGCSSARPLSPCLPCLSPVSVGRAVPMLSGPRTTCRP